MSTMRPLAIGALAGAAGTLAMDLLQYARQDEDDTFTDWEVSEADDFDDAGAPAEVGRRAASTVGIDLPDESAGPTTNVMHWLTGIGYGMAHAMLPRPDSVVLDAAVLGTGAFANSYATLGALGVYDPIWEYDLATLRRDLGRHLVYGAAAVMVSRVLGTMIGPDDAGA